MKDNSEVKLLDIKSILLTIGVILFISGTIWVFIYLRIFNFFGITHAGEIGDAVGGIAGPIINLLGAILVYKSFVVQIRANKIQVENFKNDRLFRDLWELYREAKNDLDSFEYIAMNNNEQNLTFKSLHAIDRYIKDIKANMERINNKRDFVLTEVHSILQNILLTFEKIYESDIESKDKILLIAKMKLLYGKRLEDYLEELIKIFKEKNLQKQTIDEIEKIKLQLKKINSVQHTI